MMRKIRSFIFVLFVSVPPLIQVSVADASTAGAACKKAGLTTGTTSNKLVCKKVGKDWKETLKTLKANKQWHVEVY